MSNEPTPVPAGPTVPADRGKPDAIVYPVAWMTGGNARERAMSVQDRLGPLLGGKVYSMPISDNSNFAALDPHETIYHPKWHHMAGSDRYDWVDQANGLKYGYLKKDETA